MAALPSLGVHQSNGAKAHALPRIPASLRLLFFVDHFHKGLRNGCLALVGIPVQQCQPQIDPFFSMFQPAQIGVGWHLSKQTSAR